MIRTLIVDDHKIVRQGLIQILGDTPDICVVGEAGNGREALQQLRAARHDVMLLDISMPQMDGMATMLAVKREHPKLPVLVLSMYPEDQYAIRFLKVGAAGYLTKESASDELIEAIRKVAGGGRYVTGSLADRLAGDLGRDPRKGDLAALSDRELQTLRLIAAQPDLQLPTPQLVCRQLRRERDGARLRPSDDDIHRPEHWYLRPVRQRRKQRAAGYRLHKR